MTIAYNSAYVQTETLNFTFARQAVIVYFDAKRLVLMLMMIMASSAAPLYAVLQEWPFCVC